MHFIKNCCSVYGQVCSDASLNCLGSLELLFKSHLRSQWPKLCPVLTLEKQVMSFYTAGSKVRLVQLHCTREFLFASIWKYWAQLLVVFVSVGYTIGVFSYWFYLKNCLSKVWVAWILSLIASGITFTFYKTSLGKYVKQVDLSIFPS